MAGGTSTDRPPASSTALQPSAVALEAALAAEQSLEQQEQLLLQRAAALEQQVAALTRGRCELAAQREQRLKTLAAAHLHSSSCGLAEKSVDDPDI